MNRKEFMKELEYLLQDIPEEEKEDALAYYRDYLEEAGDENEQQAIQEFGSPERVAAIIRSDLNGSLEEGGAFTESGYRDERFRDPNYQVAKRQELPETKAGAESSGGEEGKGRRQDGAFGDARTETDGNRRRRTDAADRMWLKRLLKVGILLVVLTVVVPLALGIGGTALSILAGLICLFVVLVALVGVLTAAALIGAAALLVTGAGLIAAVGLAPGLLVIGGGLLALGLGLLGIVLSVLVYGRFIPWCVRSSVDAVSRMLRGRRKGI